MSGFELPVYPFLMPNNPFLITVIYKDLSCQSYFDKGFDLVCLTSLSNPP